MLIDQTLLPAKSRYLTDHEMNLIPQSLAKEIDLRRVKLIARAHNPLAIGRILCRGYTVYWKNYPEDFTHQSIELQAVLIHELCHVWQYATGRLSALSYICNPKNWVYGYPLKQGTRFDNLPAEQQADLMQDWYRMNNGLPPCRMADSGNCPSPLWINSVIPFDFDPPIRAKRPLAEKQTPLIS